MVTDNHKDLGWVLKNKLKFRWAQVPGNMFHVIKKLKNLDRNIVQDE